MLAEFTDAVTEYRSTSILRAYVKVSCMDVYVRACERQEFGLALLGLAFLFAFCLLFVCFLLLFYYYYYYYYYCVCVCVCVCVSVSLYNT